jgi:hypothetical protein
MAAQPVLAEAAKSSASLAGPPLAGKPYTPGLEGSLNDLGVGVAYSESLITGLHQTLARVLIGSELDPGIGSPGDGLGPTPDLCLSSIETSAGDDLETGRYRECFEAIVFKRTIRSRSIGFR